LQRLRDDAGRDEQRIENAAPLQDDEQSVVLNNRTHQERQRHGKPDYATQQTR
jgi:hypothetical protein